MLNSVISKLKIRARGKPSWIGRMVIYKRDIHFLYLYQMLLSAFFRLLQSSLLRYLWPNSTARLRYDILVKQKTKGGAGLPHMELYHIASILIKIVDWFYHGKSKQWVTIEQQITSVPLTSLPQIKPKFCLPRQTLSPLA